jgi:hypothetical protein
LKKSIAASAIAVAVAATGIGTGASVPATGESFINPASLVLDQDGATAVVAPVVVAREIFDKCTCVNTSSC